MKSILSVAIICLFAMLCDSGTTLGQQNQPREPKIGYLYPAGGQQGTTFLVLLGGRQITRSNEVIFSGQGVHARVLQDTLALHINDPNERRMVHRIYLDALRELEGDSAAHAQFRRSEANQQQNAAQLGNEAVIPLDELEKKYPYIDRLKNPKAADLEIAYNYYFSPKIHRRPLEEILNRGILIEVTIDPDAEPGERDIRLLGPAGMTPPARFVVGVHPEFTEQEPNGSTSEDPDADDYRWNDAVFAPQSIRNRPPLELPIVINGQIHSGDIDRFQFRAKKGQKLVIDVQARNLRPYLADGVPGWFQAAIAIFDAEGRKLGEAASYRHEPDPVILLEIPKNGIYTIETHDSIFRGRDDFVYRIRIAESPFVTSVFPLGAKAGIPQKINVKGWNLPDNSFVFNSKNKEKGVYDISQINQTRLGRPISLALDELPEKTETEPNGKLNQAEKIRLPIIVNCRISDKKDIDIFSFEARKGTRVVLDVTARSLGSPLDAMLELLSAEGKIIASNDDRADAKGPNIGLETHHADPYLNIELPADGRYYVRVYEVSGTGGDAFAYRLRVSQPQPDFSVFCEPASIVFRQNSQPLKIHLIRKDGFEGDVRFRVANSTEVRLEDALLLAGTDEATVGLFALPRYNRGVREIKIEAVALIDGQEVVRPIVPVEEMEQAFIYRHLVRAKSFTTSRFRPGLQNQTQNRTQNQNP